MGKSKGSQPNSSLHSPEAKSNPKHFKFDGKQKEALIIGDYPDS